MSISLTIPKICLNMIVKNESKIILRLLESVSHIIDSFCICDTGSTDNTIELIENFFIEKAIHGKIVQEPFRDFGYNRTFAINSCIGMKNADYILLLDADMKLVMDPNMNVDKFKNNLYKGYAFYIHQGNDHFSYKNTRIVKNNFGIKYWGVTHEYVQLPQNTTIHNLSKQDIFISDLGDGGCKHDKTERDIRLLIQGLIQLPDNDRYTFYLANSYRDKKDYINAIEYYKKRITLGGWIEEIWYSHYNLGLCYKSIVDKPNSIFHFLEAYNSFPHRIENIYEIVNFYRSERNYNLAYTFYCLADYERKNKTNWDYLFTAKDIYEYKLDYELSIIGYHCQRNTYQLTNICMKVIANTTHQFEHRNVLSNYKFYCESLADKSTKLNDNNLQLLQNIGQNQIHILQDNLFLSSTPTISFGDTIHELIVIVRFVNYHINKNGEYINHEQIITKNVLAIIDIRQPKWTKVTEFILEYDTKYDDRYVGLEDIRLNRFIHNDVVHITYNANRCNIDNKMRVEHGTIDIKSSSCINSLFLTKNKENDCEKNWSLFNDTKCIYGWSPITIGNIQPTGFLDVTHTINQIPKFFKDVRGSTNGITIEDEIWFICHLVSYEDRRYYYHLVIVLNKNTYNLKKYTRLFSFEKQKVEYTLGMVFLESQNKFLIGYSILDRETNFKFISKRTFDDMMITC